MSKAKKAPKDKPDGLSLSEIFAMVDSGLGEVWDALNDDQKKDLKNKFFLLNRYISCPSNATLEQRQHYAVVTNERFNKHWNLLQKNHPKLLWLLLCSCNFDRTTVFNRSWVGYKKSTGGSKKSKFLAEIYPNMKMKEVEMLSELVTGKELKDLGKKYGLEDSVIEKKLK